MYYTVFHMEHFTNRLIFQDINGHHIKYYIQKLNVSHET